MIAATMAQNGRVTTQASMIARKTFQLTAPRPAAQTGAGDRRGDHVSGRDRQPEARGQEDDDAPSHLGAEAVDGVKLGDLLAQSPDETERLHREEGADGHGGRGSTGSPRWARRIRRRSCPALGGQEDHDDAHDLGGVVGAVAERHPAGRPDLHPLEEAVGPGHAHMRAAEEEAADAHQDVPDDDAQEGREEQRDEDQDDLVPVDPARARAQPARTRADRRPARGTNSPAAPTTR